MTAPRLLLSCVGENQAKWFRKMQNLVLSVRHFGGGSADMAVVVNFVGGVEPDYVTALSAIGADVRVVSQVDPRAPSSNKLRMLELAETDDFDVLLMLDCDVIVRGDLAPTVSTSQVRISPAIGNPFPPAVWRDVYAAFGVPEPTTRTVMTVTGESSHPYYNSGVMFVPRERCAPLRAAWDRARDDWFELTADRPELFRSKHCDRSTIRQDQPSLSGALARAGIEVDPLPVNLNLRTFGPSFARPYRGQWGPPFIFHYHERITPEGFLAQSPKRRVAPYLDEFNRRRAAELGVPGPEPLRRPGMSATLRSLQRNARKRARYRMTVRKS